MTRKMQKSVFGASFYEGAPSLCGGAERSENYCMMAMRMVNWKRKKKIDLHQKSTPEFESRRSPLVKKGKHICRVLVS